ADGVDGDVVAALVRVRAGVARPVGPRIEHGEVGAELTRAVELALVARGDGDGATKVLRDLQRGGGDSPTDARDEHRLAGPELRFAEHAPGGEEGKPEGRGLDGIGVAHVGELRDGRVEELAVRAVVMLAEELVF